MNIWRTVISVTAAMLTVLVFTSLLGGPQPRDTPRPEIFDPTFQAVQRQAVALAEAGRLRDAIALGTKALRIGEKSLGRDRHVTAEALDCWANTIERWHVALR